MTPSEKERLLSTVNALLNYLDENDQKDNTVITYAVKHTIERRKKQIDLFVDKSSFSTSPIAEQIKAINLFSGTTLVSNTASITELEAHTSKAEAALKIESTHHDYEKIKTNLNAISKLLREETSS